MPETSPFYLHLIPFILAFLLGSIPTSFILVKLKTGQDIRTLGSGNAGAANVFRSVGRKEGLIVLIIDFMKSFFAVMLFSKINEFPYVSIDTYRFLLGVAAIIGHVFTPLLKFKGGKGVASSGGVALAIYPYHFCAAILTWLIVLLWFRYMSLASMAAALTFAFSGFLTMSNPLHRGLAVACAVFIFWTHRTNIKRLIQRTENKFTINRPKS